MDVSRVKGSERLAAIGGLVLLVALFLKWYGISDTIAVNGVVLHTSAADSFSGWHSVSIGRWLFLLTALGAVTLALGKSAGRPPNLPFSSHVPLAGFGSLCVLWILFRSFSHPQDYLSLRAGILIALIGAAVLTFGAYRSMQAEGAGFGDLRQQADRLLKPSA